MENEQESSEGFDGCYEGRLTFRNILVILKSKKRVDEEKVAGSSGDR